MHRALLAIVIAGFARLSIAASTSYDFVLQSTSGLTTTSASATAKTSAR